MPVAHNDFRVLVLPIQTLPTFGAEHVFILNIANAWISCGFGFAHGPDQARPRPAAQARHTAQARRRLGFEIWEPGNLDG